MYTRKITQTIMSRGTEAIASSEIGPCLKIGREC